MERGDPPPPRQRARGARGRLLPAEWPSRAITQRLVRLRVLKWRASVLPYFYWLAARRGARGLYARLSPRSVLCGRCAAVNGTAPTERGGGGDAGLCCDGGLYLTAALASGRWWRSDSSSRVRPCLRPAGREGCGAQAACWRVERCSVSSRPASDALSGLCSMPSAASTSFPPL